MFTAADDRFSNRLATRLIAAGPDRAVVEQPPDGALANHVGVRHASALWGAGFAASRALVLAALGDRAPDADMRLAESEITYERVGLGVITATAEPAGPAWARLPETLGPGAGVALRTEVISRGEDGKVVVRLALTWTIEAGSGTAAARTLAV